MHSCMQFHLCEKCMKTLHDQRKIAQTEIISTVNIFFVAFQVALQLISAQILIFPKERVNQSLLFCCVTLANMHSLVGLYNYDFNRRSYPLCTTEFECINFSCSILILQKR
jgi:uncharacterized membrane protein